MHYGEKILQPTTLICGVLKVKLVKNNTPRRKAINVIVAEVFCSYYSCSKKVINLDNNPLNNCISNLAIECAVPSLKNEKWRDIKGYERYYRVSNLGRVKSLPRWGVGTATTIESIMTPVLRNKYHCVKLVVNKKIKMNKISRLVAEAFLDDFDCTLLVEHRDRNKFNDAVSNLRMATQSQNSGNKALSCTNTSGFKGVSQVGNKFRVAITISGNVIQLGTFPDAKSAARAYDKRALELFGEFACTNEMLRLYEKEK